MCSDKKTLFDLLETYSEQKTLIDFLRIYTEYYHLEQPLGPPTPPTKVKYMFRPWKTKEENDTQLKRYDNDLIAYYWYIRNYRLLKEIRVIKTIITELQNKQ